MAKLLEIIANYTGADFRHDLMIAGIAFAYIVISILIPVTLRKRNLVSKFTARKIVHLFTGLVVLIVPFFILPLHAVIIALIMTVLVYFSSKESSVKELQVLFESISEEAEESGGRLQGPFHYSISITLLIAVFVLFAPDRLYFPICGILIMIASDTLASVIGQKYGHIKLALAYTGSQRTLEGSLAFFISAFLLCFSAFSFFGMFNPASQKVLSVQLVVFYSLITALTGTLVELLSPSAYDDLTVPIASTAVIYFLAMYI